MVSITHTMTLGRFKKKLVESKEQISPKAKNKLTLFSVILTKLVDIVFKQTIDNIKEGNKNYINQ